jgi:excisionase family DNA binding protein
VVAGNVLTLGQAAKRLGVPSWTLRRLITSGRLAEPARLGAYRIFYESQLDDLRAALVARGYLRQTEAASA